MKLSVWARKNGVSYRTAWRLCKEGYIKGHQVPTGTIIVTEDEKERSPGRAVIYARVSDRQRKDDLERQAERLTNYALAKGYKIVRVVKEIGSGVNDQRRKLLELFKKDDYDIILVEHKDRLTRFGFNYIKELLEARGIEAEVANDSARRQV
jgi:putative resolvase